MNREEFKASLLKVAKEEPHIMNILSLANNVGAKQRLVVYARESVYIHSEFGLLIRILVLNADGEAPICEVQFRDGLTPPPEWSQEIQGDLAAENRLREFVYEKVEIENDVIYFRQYRHTIKAQLGDRPLKFETDMYRGVHYDLNRGILDQSFMHIARLGRSKSLRGNDYYLDYVIDEATYLDLFKQLRYWAIRSHFLDDDMKRVKDFCVYCKQVKSTKTTSKMVRIIEYLRDNPLPLPKI